MPHTSRYEVLGGRRGAEPLGGPTRFAPPAYGPPSQYLEEPLSFLEQPYDPVQRNLFRKGIGFNPRGETSGMQMQRIVGMYLLPQILARIQAGNTLTPLVGQATSRLAHTTKQARLDQFRNQALTSAADVARQIGSTMRGQGLGTGAVGGELENLYAGALGDITGFERYLYSPQYEQELLALLDQLQGIPQLGAFASLMGAQPTPFKQQQPDWFGQIIGQGLGGWGAGGFR